MYQSRTQIEKKLAQSKYIYKQIKKFQKRIFVNGGIDRETGAHPLLTLLSSFLSSTRSVLQYSYKEAKETEQLDKYQELINKKPIFKFFKDLRDSDIHEYVIGSHMTISSELTISQTNSDANIQTTGKVPVYVEDLSDLDAPKGSNEHLDITTTLSVKIEITDELLKQFEAEDKQDLIEAVNQGKELYRQAEFDGEVDLFVLCEKYVSDLEHFVTLGISNGIIS